MPVVTTIAAGLPAAVLWDMDGTLIDSEPYWIEEEHALVESFGGVWSEEHAHALVGNALEVSAQYIIDHSPVDLGVTEVVERLMHGVMRRVVAPHGEVLDKPERDESMRRPVNTATAVTLW